MWGFLNILIYTYPMSSLISVPFAITIHDYTHSIVFACLCVLIAGLLFYSNKRYSAVIFFISFVVTAGFVVILKQVLAVPRPEEALIEIIGYALPSNHAALSVFLATSLTWVLFTDTKFTKTAASSLSALLFLLALVITLSRLTLHVHTPFQVIVGALLGITIPLLTIFGGKYFRKFLGL